jgi:hypothetical protein
MSEVVRSQAGLNVIIEAFKTRSNTAVDMYNRESQLAA